MNSHRTDLWNLTRGRPEIDPSDLAEAVEMEAGAEDLDYRTRLLIRDSVEALKKHWGPAPYRHWISGNPQRARIETICSESFDKVGFPSLQRRLMEKTKPELIRQFLEHVGRFLRHETRVEIAGSVALIMPGFLDRHTEDIDVIDEVPKELRDNHQLLQELQDNYGLQLGHVQSHYFPTGWRDRLHSLGNFGKLNVFLVDVYDVFLSKLFSARVKDVGDLRMLIPQLDKAVLTTRFKDTCISFLAAPRLATLASDNWQILFGEALPS